MQPSTITLAVCTILICSSLTPRSVEAGKCSRTPEGHGALKTPADGRFHIRISENTAKYTPGKTYTITLEGIDAGIRQVSMPLRHKFSGFMLVAEKKSNESGIEESLASYGVFTLLHGSTLTKISCANMVTHTTTTPKSEVQVLWTAPEPGSGCISFKATVIEHRDVWYMDDGPLTKDFCEDEQNFDDTLTSQIDPCCACAEAKYELTFEGLWSRNTHPKDFPSNSWLTRFSDIIGATHTVDYRFWQYGEQASDGLQQVAEHGATRMLEAELKGQSEHIRTIIKARGLAYPNVTGKTFAVFRVDPNHHLVSFVSMIDPSPDWFLGVAGLELCLPNCSWIENKVLDLYPWDAGTDSGPTYISPDQPTNPRDHIRRIKPDYPNDPRSPFYDPNAFTMKPLARLYLLRQRLYERDCPEDPSEDNSSDGKACAVGPWSKWSKCNVECGKGSRYRQRAYVNDNQAVRMDCKKELTQRDECTGAQASCDGNNSAEQEETTEANCALTEWSEWSECTPKCGDGTQIKRRKYVNKRAKKRCEGGDVHPPLILRQDCSNPACVGEITPSGEEDGGQEPDEDRQEEPGEEDERGGDGDGGGGGEEETTDPPDCELREWTPWSPCSVSCGGGVKMRFRRPYDLERCGNESTQEASRPCNQTPCEIPEFCYEDPEIGGCRNASNMWFFNRNHSRCDVFTWSCGDHGNRFATNDECSETCTGITSDFRSRVVKNRFNTNRRRNNNAGDRSYND